jgi:ergothioneine biosynthesis protein EgtB
MLAEQDRVTLQSALLDRFAGARKRTDDLFSIVKSDALYDRPIPERHRIIFYLGHVEAFDWNLLHDRIIRVESFDPKLDRLFAFGIDPVNGQLPSDVPGDWPAIDVVRDYVRRVRETLDKALNSADFGASVAADQSPTTLLNVAVEHRLMHAETLAYMLHQLPLERKVKQTPDALLSAPQLTPGMIRVPEGKAVLGLSRSGGEFGWDNEFEEHTVHVPAFAVDRFKITNGQFLEFMAAGGYEKSDLWTSADWDWKTQQNISAPSFWRYENRNWDLLTMFDRIPLPLDWPVYVSHAEASAYARWAGKRLPTEAQWHRAAYGTPNGGERAYPWGSANPAEQFGNFNFQRWDPAPVHAFPQGRSAFGIEDLVGNGWEWTSTVFGPFAGFEKFAFYPGYSADFFDGRHYVMKGGSARTAACMLRKTFRNWFQPHYGYVYSGFRCVTD